MTKKVGWFESVRPSETAKMFVALIADQYLQKVKETQYFLGQYRTEK